MTPRQHGAWTILSASYLIGVIAGVKFGGRIGAESFFLLAAIVSGFLLRHAIAVFLRSGRLFAWVAVYSIMSLSSAALLIFYYNRVLFAYFGLVAAVAMTVSLILERLKLDRTLAGEIAGALGLSIAAPVSFYITAGRAPLTETAILWAVPAIFFGLNVVFVRHALRHSEFTTRQIGYTALACTVIFMAIVIVML